MEKTISIPQCNPKASYLKYLPYTWRLLELRLKNSIFNDLRSLLDKAVPKKNRTKVKF